MILQSSTTVTQRSQPNALIRLFSSIKFGIVLLTLILIYASIASALPQVRGAVEMTEMQIFQHWLFAVLVALFCATMIVTTWRRVRWNLTNAGLLTTHVGLLLLTGGSVWYFANKIEGDVILFAPHIQLTTTGPSGRVIAQVLANEKESWSSVMPALGGRVKLTVVDTQGGGIRPVTAATVLVEIGDQPPRSVPLDAEQAPMQGISDRLALRMRASSPERTFYDQELAALYSRPVGAAEEKRQVVPIKGLPVHRERFLPGGPELKDRIGHRVESKRTWPHLDVLGLKIPTGWFEHWRLPIKLATPQLPFDVEVTGYLPYVTEMRSMAVASEDSSDAPGANLDVVAGLESITASLFATPRDSLLATGVPLEMRWVENEEQRTELLKPLAGPHELYVEIKDPPLKQTIAISAGQTIKLDGTPYELTIKSLEPSWPLISPGYGGASSPMASVDVKSAAKSFNRTVIQRFPQLTQDIDETGKRHREPYDPNIILRYRGTPRGWLMLVAGPNACRHCPPKLGFFDDAGQVQEFTLNTGVVQRLDLWGTKVDVTLTGVFDHAKRTGIPTVEPLEYRRPNLGRGPSAIRLTMTGRGEHADWVDTQWCSFSQYPHVDTRPLVVRGPDDQQYELVYSRFPRDLNGQLALHELQVKFFPGKNGVESWRSEFVAQPDGESPSDAAVYTNQTYNFGRWTLFQSGAPGREPYWEWTSLGVGNRQGIWTMVLGCILVPLGSMYAFYVKPVLIRRRKAAALATAGARGTSGGRIPADRSDLLEVGG